MPNLQQVSSILSESWPIQLRTRRVVIGWRIETSPLRDKRSGLGILVQNGTRNRLLQSRHRASGQNTQKSRNPHRLLRRMFGEPHFRQSIVRSRDDVFSELK